MTKKMALPPKLFTQGGEVDLKGRTPEEFASLATEHGLAFYMATCDKARNCSAVLRAFAKAVDYPVFFGSDMDSLMDCLEETIADQKKGIVLWIDQLHSGDPNLKIEAKAIMGVLKDVVDWASEHHKVFIYGVVHAGKHAAPEPGVAPARYAEGADEDLSTQIVPEEEDE